MNRIRRITHSPFAADLRAGVQAVAVALGLLLTLWAGVELGMFLDDATIVIDQDGRTAVVEVYEP